LSTNESKNPTPEATRSIRKDAQNILYGATWVQIIIKNVTSFIPTKSELGAVETVRLKFHDGYAHSRKCPDGEYVKFPIGDKCALFIQMSSLEWWIGAGTHVPKMPAIYRQPVQMIYKYRLFDVIPGPGDKERLDSIINLMVGDL
jgi:hypothetical protein